MKRKKKVVVHSTDNSLNTKLLVMIIKRLDVLLEEIRSNRQQQQSFDRNK